MLTKIRNKLFENESNNQMNNNQIIIIWKKHFLILQSYYSD